MPAERRRVVVSAALAVLLVGGFVWALGGHWSDIVDSLREQRPAVLLSALMLSVAGVLMSFAIWRGVLAAPGSDLPAKRVARMFFVGQLGKYLPGAVWPVVTQMRMGQALGLPRQRVGLAFVLTLGLSVLWALVIGLSAVPALLADGGPLVALSIVVAVPCIAVLLVPRVLNHLLGFGFRLLRRPEPERALAPRDVVRGSVATLAFWAVYGSHVWVLAIGLGADPWRALPAAVGGFAVAFSLGPLLVVLPAGAGVREAVLVVTLSSVMSTGDATAVALTSRGLLMVTDGLLAAVSVLLPRRDPSRDREADPA